MGEVVGLSIVLKVIDQITSPMRQIGSNILSSVKGPAGGVVATVMAITAAVVAVGAASVGMASQYQQSMNMVRALTGSSAQQMAYYNNGLMQLAVNAGVAPNALAQGLYNVLSASYKGATAIQVLTLATEDAKIGMTSATVTTDALTNILRSFGTRTQDITRVNGEMLQTVTLGKATFAQYATTIVKSASAATQFHVSMETMNAAWSTMTSSGIKAAQASTDFQASLKVMYGNIGTVTASLHKNGIAFDEAKFNSMDYGHKIQYLNAALQLANEKHVHVTGVTLQAAQAISAISKHIGDYNSNLATLSNKQQMAQKTQQAWAITQSGFRQTLDRVKASLDVVMIGIGQALLPILTHLAEAVLPIISRFGTWITSGNRIQNALSAVGTVVKQVGSFVMSNLVPPVMRLATAIFGVVQKFLAWNEKSHAVQNVLGFVGAVLSKVIGFVGGLVDAGAGLITWLTSTKSGAAALYVALGVVATILSVNAVQAVGAFVASIPGIISGFVAWAAGAWATAAANIAAFWPIYLVVGIIIGVIALVVLAVKNWGKIAGWLQGVWNGVKSFFVGLWNGIVGLFQAVVSRIGGVLKILGVIALIALAPIVLPILAIILVIKNWGAIMAWLKGVVAVVTSAVGGFFSGLGSLIGRIVGAVGSAFSTLGSLVRNVWSGIAGAVRGAINAVIGAINGFIGFIDSIQIHIPSIGVGPVQTPAFDWNGLGLPKLPTLATGGRATRPGLAVVGERGAEVVGLAAGDAVYPHGSVPAQAMGGGRAIVINITYNVSIHAPAGDADKLYKVFKDRMGRDLRRSTNLVTMSSGGRSSP